MTIPVSIAALIDGVLIATAHAFRLAGLPTNALRFVVLNLGSYLSLTLSFAIFLAPLRDRFSPPLTWRRAITVAFVSTTGSNALSPAVPQYWFASVVVGAATIFALYYVFVILVVAVGHANNDGVTSR